MSFRKHSSDPNRGVDGGGVKGITSLLILDSIFTALGNSIGRAVHPHEYFDLIGGTSTGGLIAIMLGRLRLSIADCIQCYETLSTKVFPPQGFSENFKYGKAYFGKPWYDARRLEIEIEKILLDQGYAKDLPLRDESTCKVFVCAAVASSSQPVLLRSYEADLINYDCSIVEAARATSAAPLFFAPVTFKKCGTTFVDGGMKANNPITFLLHEAIRLWPSRPIGCVVSLGTGIKDAKPFGTKIRLLDAIEPLIEAAFDAQGRARMFEMSFEGSRLDDAGAYFRFSVEHGLGDVAFDKSDKIKSMKSATGDYVRDRARMILKCANAMLSTTGVIFADPGARSDLSRSDELQAMSNEFDTRLTTDIKPWLRPPDEANKLSDHFDVVAKQQNDSTQWVFSLDQYASWEQSQERLMWICGRPGCGKSTIASSIIRRLKAHFPVQDKDDGMHFVGYAFCNKLLDESKTDASAICRTILWQAISPNFVSLSHQQKCSLLRAWQSSTSAGVVGSAGADACLRGSELYHVLREHLSSFRQVFLVVDGLDECTDHEVLLKEILRMLDPESRNSNVRLLFISQELPSIRRHLARSSIVRMDDDAIRAFTTNDIALFVRHSLSFSDIAQEALSEIQDIICSKAAGMFLWAFFAVQKVIDQATLRLSDRNGELILATKDLPREMSKMFLSYLDRVVNRASALHQYGSIGGKALILASLKWVFHANRPLTLAELCAALNLFFASELSANPASEFELDEKLLRRIFEFCYPITYLRENTIQIMHSSLKDDVLQQERSSTDLNTYIGAEGAQIQMAETCVRYLQQDAFYDFVQVSNDEIEVLSQLYPLLRYAVENWLPHLTSSTTYNSKISEFLAEFLESWNAITWLELWVRMVGSSLSFLQGTPFVNPRKLFQGSGADMMWIKNPDWITVLLRESVSQRELFAADHPFTIELMYELTVLLKGRGDLTAAKEQAEAVYKYRTENPGENKTEYQVYLATNMLAMVYSSLRKWTEAETLYSELLVQTKELYGEKSRHRLSVKANLASLYSAKTEYVRAKKLTEEVYDARKTTLGAMHKDTINSLNSLTFCNLSLSNFEEARRTGLMALNFYTEVQDRNPQDEYLVLNNLSSVEDGLGNYKEGLRFGERAWKGREALLGPKHTDTLVSMSNYACSLLHLEKYQDAEAILKTAIARWEEKEGANPGAVLSKLTAMSNLEVAVDQQGRTDEALELCRTIISTRQHLLGDGHPDVLTSLNNFCITLGKKGKHEEAMRLAATNYSKMRQIFGVEHGSTISSASTLQSAISTIGLRSFSEYLTDQTRLIVHKRFENQIRHPEILRWDHAYAISLSEQGRWREAEVFLKRSIAAASKYSGKSHGSLTILYLGLARLWLNRGRYDLSESSARKGDTIESGMETTDPTNGWIAKQILAELHAKRGNPDKAVVLLEQVIDARLEKFDAESFNMVPVYGRLAEAQLALGSHAKAKEIAMRALQISKAAVGDRALTVAWMKQILARTLRLQQKLDESSMYQEDALEIRRSVCGDYHWLSLSSQHSNALLLFDKGSKEEAERQMCSVVSGRKTVLEPNHPDFLESLSEWNRIRGEIGLHKHTAEVEGIDLGTEHEQRTARLTRALREAQTVLEPDSALICDMKRSLAELQQGSGENITAKELLQDVLLNEVQNIQSGDVKALKDLENVIDLAKDQNHILSDTLLQSALLAAIKTKNVPLLVKILHSRPDLTFRDEETKCTALGLAAIEGDDAIVKPLLACGADPNVVEVDNKTSLHLAAENGWVSVIECLLESGADVDGPTTDVEISQRPPPIWYAALKGHLAAVELLLKAGADPSNPTLDTKPIHCAANLGHVAILQKLIEAGTDVEVKSNGKGLTALGFAAHGAKLDAVEYLLEAGADYRHVTLEGNTLLHLASEGGNLKIVELLMERGLNPADANNVGGLSIHFAALNGSMEVLRELSKSTANLSPQVGDAEGSTPLSIAARAGFIDFVKLLLDLGVDPNIRNKDGRTALHGACIRGKFDIAEALLMAGADPNLADQGKNTPLVLAILKGYIDIVRRLLKAGAQATTGYESTYSPLIYAAVVGDRRIVAVLLKQTDTNVNERSVDGISALYAASIVKKTDVISLLLKSKADPNIAHSDGSTPLHAAARKLDDQSIRLLLSFKADESCRDCWGRKPIDWMDKDAQALNRFSSKERTPSALQAEIRQRTIVEACTKLESKPEAWLALTNLAISLLLSGDVDNAIIALEMSIRNADEPDESWSYGEDCDMCGESIVGRYRICKTCANCQLCSACFGKYQAGEQLKFCSHNDFIQVPRACWKQLAKGTVDLSGESRADWLRRTSEKYSKVPTV